ncbi:MAG: sensor histidine kinase [Gemmatimonadaceae bacterium]
MQLAALQVPLAAKLIGANAMVVAALIFACMMSGGTVPPTVIAVGAVVLLVHVALVYLALGPIRDLESVASQLWQGDFGARVTRSSVADDGVLRIGSMFNILLDGLVTDRARLRTLTAEVIATGDRERAALARELHDSTAQQIAALLLQLSSAARDAEDPALSDRLLSARDATEGILEEVRAMSHSVHPGVLDDLGLEAALRRLARDASHGNGVEIDVDVDIGIGRLDASVERVLYRIAQEAVRNAIKHASPEHIRIKLYRDTLTASLDVRDDGTGFNLDEAEERRSGIGLLSMRERAVLVEGEVEIKTAKGSGTTVLATIPLEPALEPVD